jgi:hypothetical protein
VGSQESVVKSSGIVNPLFKVSKGKVLKLGAITGSLESIADVLATPERSGASSDWSCMGGAGKSDSPDVVRNIVVGPIFVERKINRYIWQMDQCRQSRLCNNGTGPLLPNVFYACTRAVTRQNSQPEGIRTPPLTTCTTVHGISRSKIVLLQL